MPGGKPRGGWPEPAKAPANVASYRAAQLAARQRMGQIDALLGQRINASLLAYAKSIEHTLAGELSGLPGNDIRRRAAELSQKVVLQTHAQLKAALQQAVQQHRDVSFDEVLGIWQDASLSVADANGVPNALLGAVRAPSLAMLGAFESVKGYTWKTALNYATLTGSDEVAHIIRAGLTEGLGGAEISRRLRPYVLGADELGELAGTPLNSVPKELRGAAKRMRYNAERIGFTEVHNARAEAEVQMFMADPTIGGVRWTLSPSRGSLKPPDICDYLASIDQYGLGPGVFPIGRVPPSPHPFDRCERMPVHRPRADWGQPKIDTPPVLTPTAALVKSKLRGGWSMSPARADAIARDAKQWLAAMNESVGAQLAAAKEAIAAAAAAQVGELEAAQLVEKAAAAYANVKSKQVTALKRALASAQAALEEATELGAPNAIAQAKALVDEIDAKVAAKHAANKLAAAKAAATKKAAKEAAAKAAAELKAKIEARAMVGVLQAAQKLYNAKTSVKLMQEAADAAQAALDAAISNGAADASVAAKAVLDQAEITLAAKKAANKISYAKAKAKKAAQAQAAEATEDAAEVVAQATASAAARTSAAAVQDDVARAAAQQIDAKTVLGKQLAGASGSNPGGVYLGTDGVKRYVKFYDDPAQALGERIANDLYGRLGIATPESIVFTHNGKLAHASTVIDDLVGTISSAGLTEKRADAILDGFAADVLTANWDAVGMSLDNVVVLKSGVVARIDQGGTFLMRAQKARRKDAKLLTQITEWENFNTHINPAYSSVFTKAGVSGALDLGERVIKQIDDIEALQKALGGWAGYVDQLAPGLTAADRSAIVGMLDARTKLLLAKRADVRKYIVTQKRAAAEAVKLQAELQARIAAGANRQILPEDAAQIASFQTRIQQKVPKADLQAASNAIRTNVAVVKFGRDVRSRISAQRAEAVMETLRARGLASKEARAVYQHVQSFFGGWHGSASSSGAGALKWAAQQLEGLETHFHSHFIDFDKAKQTAVMKAGQHAATEGGKYSAADVLAAIRAEHNYTRAFMRAIGVTKVKMWRRVNANFFKDWKIPVPKLGETGTVHHNGVTGWTFVRGSYNGDVEFEAEFDADDILQHFWTHNRHQYENEHEIWVFGRPVMHKVTKSPRK